MNIQIKKKNIKRNINERKKTTTRKQNNQKEKQQAKKCQKWKEYT